MRLTFTGHAGLLIEARGTTILCDPWMSNHGAFTAGWFQYPDNHHLADWLRARTIDYIYISHEHRDHFDEEFLNSLPKTATVLVPGYPSRPWREQVKALGFAETCFLKTFEPFEAAPGVTVTLVHAPSPYVHDSAIVVEDAESGQVVINLNDCKIDEDQARVLRERYPAITAVFAQFSGANWFPFAYDFPADERREASRKKVRNGMNRWTGYMRALRPRWAIPNAGPATMLDPNLRSYAAGPDSIFPTPADLVRFLEREDPELAARTQPMLPGDVLDLDADRFIPEPELHAAFDWDNAEGYTDAYAERMAPYVAEALDAHPWPEESQYPAFQAYWAECFAAAPRFATRVDARVLFEVDGPGGGRWLVDFPRLTVSDLTGDPRPREELCEYAFRFESRYLPALLDTSLRWEDFFLSFRFRAWRTSIAAYNETLMSFLRFGRPSELRVQEALLNRANQDYESSCFTLRTAQGDYAVQQFCPHMGQQLGPEQYDPERGTITCPRHGWVFNVPGGECLNARSRLKIEALDQELATASGDD